MHSKAPGRINLARGERVAIVLPGFYPSVEPRRFDEAGALSDQT
jgi:hypothetical protein